MNNKSEWDTVFNKLIKEWSTYSEENKNVIANYIGEEKDCNKVKQILENL